LKPAQADCHGIKFPLEGLDGAGLSWPMLLTLSSGDSVVGPLYLEALHNRLIKESL
jgi:hypothetical protein